MQMHTGDSCIEVLRWYIGEMRAMLECVQIYTKEFLSSWHENLLTSQPCGLEDIHCVCSASPRSSLDR